MGIRTDDPQKKVQILYKDKTATGGGELLTTTFRLGAFDVVVVAPIPDLETTSCSGYIKLRNPADSGMDRASFLQLCQMFGFSERKTNGTTTPNQTRQDREEVRDDDSE